MQEPTLVARTETQEKCLTSLDELIKLEELKLELLRTHRKGLIQKFEKEASPATVPLQQKTCDS